MFKKNVCFFTWFIKNYLLQIVISGKYLFYFIQLHIYTWYVISILEACLCIQVYNLYISEFQHDQFCNFELL